MGEQRTPRAFRIPALAPYVWGRTAVTAWWSGSLALGGRACAWCSAADSWGGVIRRAGGVLFGAACLVRAGQMEPAVIPSLVAGAWSVAAWALAPPAAEADPGEQAVDDGREQDEPTGPISPEAFVDLLREVIGESSGTHLAIVRDRLARDHPDTPWDFPAVRALCSAARVPVTPSVRVRRAGVSPGIRARDLPPAPAPPLGTPPVAGSSAGQPATATATPGKRGRVVRIGEAVRISYDPDHAHPVQRT